MPTEPVFLRWEHTNPPHHAMSANLLHGFEQFILQKSAVETFSLI